VLTVLPGFVKTKMTEGINLPPVITTSPKLLSNFIFKNCQKSKLVYPLPWRIIMIIIKNIPERIFKKTSL